MYAIRLLSDLFPILIVPFSDYQYAVSVLL
jgi:hypothetical protein